MQSQFALLKMHFTLWTFHYRSNVYVYVHVHSGLQLLFLNKYLNVVHYAVPIVLWIGGAPVI